MKNVTKAVIKKRVSNLLSNWPLNVPLGESDFNLLLDLLEKHPEFNQKIGCGIDHIEIRTNPVYKNRGFYIVRCDGSVTDFSYRKCFNAPSQKQKFLNALRVAILPQILNFKSRYFNSLDGEPVCPITGEPIDELNCHVDHKPPQTFDNIAKNFILNEGIDPNNIKITGVGCDGCVKHELEDKELENRWRAYHASNCCLRVVSPKSKH